MITERDIAEKFSVVWKQHFPLLNSNFMRMFNESQVKQLNKIPIPIKENIKYDLVSEAAFILTNKLIENDCAIEEFLSDKTNLLDLITQTAFIIWKSGNYTKKDLVLSKVEIEEISSISKNIFEFIKINKKESVQFKPTLKGYGIFPDLEADISIDDTLYEIKTVNRNFKSSDLKQLFIYLALGQVSDNMIWNYAGLYNPRKGTYCKFNIKSMVNNLTGGLSPNETFENLLNSLDRDIQIDSRF
ncbi:hypothetical protein ACT3CE_00585 [Marinifilum sp. RC60d5]|uniref:hypothetical protein n=1 Tax=Marinifilum sp. RC60d5 TaxID=3458414 RepID=UPI0040374006